MQQIADWLGKLGLGQYAQRFAENDIDFDILRVLTDQDLEKIGVTSLGHRRKMLHAIAELGEAIPSAPTGSATKPEREPPDEAERRHLTVMFCDLVGSTALATRLDPEDMWRVVASYQAAIGAVIGRYQGMIAQYMGDGVLAYFGYPVAQEDSAVQAVRAALEIIDAVASLRIDVSTALQARIGIATGTVVMNDLLVNEIPAEKAIVGETPNVAARLQTLAEPGTVLICPSTRQLTGGYFDYRDLGQLSLKGFAQPISASQVLGMSGVESRFEAMHTSRLPPLFGREEEMDLLLRRWRQATQEEAGWWSLRESRVLVSRTLRWRLMNGSRANHTSRCAISALRIIPTAHSPRSSTSSNVPPALGTATLLKKSSANSTLYCRNPHTIPNIWQF